MKLGNKMFSLKSLLIFLIAGFAVTASAAICVWNSEESMDWGDFDNWRYQAGVVDPAPPGNTNGIYVADYAYFKGDTYGNKTLVQKVMPDKDRSIAFIFFEEVGPGNAGSYVIGESDGNSLLLTRPDGAGYLSMQNITTPYTTNTIACPLLLVNSYQLQNECSEITAVFHVTGDIKPTEEGEGGTQLQLKGKNRGINLFSGKLSNSDSEERVISLGKLGDGTWWVSGTNTFSGFCRITQGTLVVMQDVPASGPSPLGTRNVIELSWEGNAGDASLLLDEGITVSRNISTRHLSTKFQTTGVGGANTNGISSFTGNINTQRNIDFYCADGGTFSLDRADWSLRDDFCCGVGRPGYEGIVDITGKFTIPDERGICVSNGTLRVSGNLHANTSVTEGGILEGSGSVVGDVTIAGTFLERIAVSENIGTGNMLTVDGDISLEEGSAIQIEVSDSFRGEIVALRATGDISGEFTRLDAPKFCFVEIRDVTEGVGREVVIKSQFGSLLFVK